MTGGGRGIAGFFQPLRHGEPFLAPCIGFALAQLQTFTHHIDFAHGYRAIGRHALGDEQRIRPQLVAGKGVDPMTIRCHTVCSPGYKVRAKGRPWSDVTGTLIFMCFVCFDGRLHANSFYAGLNAA